MQCQSLVIYAHNSLSENGPAAVNGNSSHATHLHLAGLAAAGEDMLSFEPAQTFLESVRSLLRSSARKCVAAWTVAACVGTKETLLASHDHKCSLKKTERASQTRGLHNGIVLKKKKINQNPNGRRRPWELVRM